MIAGVSMGNLKKSSILLVMFQPMETSSFKSKDQENTPDPTKYHHFSSWNPQVSRAEKKVSVCASQKQSNLLILQRAQFQISSPEMWKGDLTSPKMDQNVGFHQKWWLNHQKWIKSWISPTKMVVEPSQKLGFERPQWWTSPPDLCESQLEVWLWIDLGDITSDPCF